MPDPDGAWLVVGLGNPGPSYSRTRHNAGYLVADLLAERMAGSASPWRSHRSGRAQVVEGRLGGIPGAPRVVLGRARSYMNESGGPVSTLLGFYKIPVERLVAVHDELDIPLGELRLKFGGGDNGHNGLRSLRRSLGTGDYYRVRFGVGRPPGRRPTADHVLSDFSAGERRDLDAHVDRAADAVECLLTDGLAKAQNLYNG
ncbi:MAG TPA: aminoacyl-tRNA hydrolase [Nocardioidaceae bacterium]|nr:aminoacyl-tRNA hydrolase [Nocardioidaceae bacterium]